MQKRTERPLLLGDPPGGPATAEDHIINHLTVTVGYLGLLRDSPRLPPELREWVREALLGAQDAARLVHQRAAAHRARPAA